MKSTFKIMFFIRKDRVNAAGQAPIHTRLTIDGDFCQFSTKASVTAKIWDVKSYRAKGHSEEADRINLYLDHFKKTLLNHYQSLFQSNETVTPAMVRDKYMGKETKENTLLSMFRHFIEQQRPLVGIDITQSTFNKYVLTYNRLDEFLSVKMNKKDIPMYSIDRDFVLSFHTFLKVDHRLSVNSSEKLMRIFKRITTLAFKTGMIKQDPFAVYTIKKVKTNRGFLTEEEFAKIYNFRPMNDRLQKVRDFFVFACLTGLDYSTLSSLTEDNVIERNNGVFIITPRIKTREISQIKLLPQALEILDKYRNSRERKADAIFPMMSNAKYNLYLKEIAQKLDIAKRVTSHLARHTFATTMTLGKGVPIESVSKMLGHTNIQTTQIYARITADKIGKDMDILSRNLGNLDF